MKKGITYGLALVVGLGLISGGVVHHSNAVEAKAKHQSEQRYVQAKNAVRALYTDSAQTVPVTHISQDQIQQTKQVIKRVSDKEQRQALMKKCRAALTMDTARRSVDGLITHHVLNSHATLAQISDVEKDVAPVKDISLSFYHTLEASVNDGLKQYNHIQEAKKDLKQETPNMKADIKTTVQNHAKSSNVSQSQKGSSPVTHNNVVASSNQPSSKATSHSSNSVSHSNEVATNHSVSHSSGTSSVKKPSSSSSRQPNSSTSSRNSSSGNVKYGSVKKTGHGVIPGSGGSRTYDEWTYDGVDTSKFTVGN